MRHGVSVEMGTWPTWHVLEVATDKTDSPVIVDETSSAHTHVLVERYVCVRRCVRRDSFHEYTDGQPGMGQNQNVFNLA